jgi:hypothetical protein
MSRNVPGALLSPRQDNWRNIAIALAMPESVYHWAVVGQQEVIRFLPVLPVTWARPEASGAEELGPVCLHLGRSTTDPAPAYT